MHKKTLAWLMLASVAAGLHGCDSQASQQAEAQKHLEAARAKLSLANAGYIATPQAEPEQSLTEYRQQSMQQVYQDLNKVLSLDAPLEKAQALELTADIDASAARHLARQAAVEQAALLGRATVLTGYLAAVEKAALRSEAAKPNVEAQIQALKEQVRQQKDKLAELQTRAQDLEKQIQHLNAKIESFKAKAEAAYAQAQKLREQAFVSRGDRMYELQDEAAKFEREAARMSAEAEAHQVQADALTAEKNLVTSQAETAERLIQQYTSEIQSITANAQRQADEAAQAAREAEEALKALIEEYQQIAGVHERAVDNNMRQAIEKAGKAVQGLQQAVSLVQRARGDVNGTKLHLLAAYVDQAHLTSTYTNYLKELEGVTRMVLGSVERVSEEAAQTLRDRVQTLMQTQADLKDTVNQAIEAGLALVEELAPAGSTAQEGGDVALALQQKQRLETYRQITGG